MENVKKFSFGYEDTDKKIEIELYGLIFEINKEKILEKDINNINSNDETKIEKEIEDIIGKGSIEKINRKRISDGYNKMTLDVEVAVLTCIYKTYIETTTGGLIGGIEESSNNMIQRAENMNNYNRYNREERRNFNRYRNNRRNYRRY